MAFDKTPSQSTYQTKTLSLVRELNNRGSDTSKDEDLLNIFPELIKNKDTKEFSVKLVKRDGTTSFIALAGNVRGMHYWKDENNLYVAISDDVYIYNAITGALIDTKTAVFSTFTGHVGFCEFLYDTGDVKIVVTDGTTLSTIDSAHTVVAGADADMPVHLPYPVFLDGYLFILKSGTADIYNSNLNDPLAYTAGDFITAEMRPDEATYITVLNNYILVIGFGSIEYFWDAAIATGSPLQRNDTPIKLTGFYNGAAKKGNRFYFVGAENNASPDVFVLEDFKMKSLGNEAVRRHLASLPNFGLGSTGVYAGIASIGGHDFYVLSTSTATYVLELESGLWHRWAFQGGTTFAVRYMLNIVTGAGAVASKCLFNLEGVSTLFKFDPTLYQDNGTNFTCTVVTDKVRFDTYKTKFISRLVVWANKPSSSSLLSISWTDNDYQTFSTARTVDISTQRPRLDRLGKFRERAFKFTFTDNQPFILLSVEVDLNMGQN